MYIASGLQVGVALGDFALEPSADLILYELHNTRRGREEERKRERERERGEREREEGGRERERGGREGEKREIRSSRERQRQREAR